LHAERRRCAKFHPLATVIRNYTDFANSSKQASLFPHIVGLNKRHRGGLAAGLPATGLEIADALWRIGLRVRPRRLHDPRGREALEHVFEACRRQTPDDRDTSETKQADSTDRVTEHEREGQSVASPDRSDSRPAPTYVVRLRHDLQASDVTRLLRYISDFGFGDARGHALDGGWCLRLSKLADLRLLSSQCAELIEGHDIEYSGEAR
jgi:hypothetical protein